MLTQAPKGTQDMLPKDAHRWHAIEKAMRDVCALAGYREIRTPMFEHTELFQRGVGDTTDVVQKEMYTFFDKGNRSITLKPEGTAGVVRAFIESHMYADPLPAKMYYARRPISDMKSRSPAVCASSIKTAWKSLAQRTPARTQRSFGWPWTCSTAAALTD